MSNEIKNTINDPFNPLEPMGRITTSSNTGGLVPPTVVGQNLKTLHVIDGSAALGKSLYKNTPEYKTPA